MGKAKSKSQTRHGLLRMKSRAGVKDKKKATQIIRAASKNGLSISQFNDGAFKEYLKTKDVGKRVKVYKGYIYIFNKNSDRVITLYPIPQEYMEEYNEYGKQ